MPGNTHTWGERGGGGVMGFGYQFVGLGASQSCVEWLFLEDSSFSALFCHLFQLEICSPLILPASGMARRGKTRQDK